MENKQPRVGVGVIVKRDSKILLGKRKGSHGEGTWNFPGGSLDFNEEIFDCAKREVREEAGIEITHLTVGPYTNDFFEEGKHYITLFVICEYASGEVSIREPDKCEQWKWFTWNELPEPLFLPIQNLLKQDFSPFQ
jgi:8-oxo-dGTP diphosphatase